MKITSPAIPFDSVVVVIGANGYIGVETCEKVLQAGFRARGTVRDVQKNQWMHKLFDERWPGKFELVRVEDFEVDGAFDEAFRGAAGVIYVSTPILFRTDPSTVIDPIVRGTLNTLAAAARAGVRRYVLSSSSKAVEDTVLNAPHELTAETFNRPALARARESYYDSAADAQRALTVYCASRTAAELAFWDWLRDNNPPFVANAVVPDGNFGRALGAPYVDAGAASSVGMLRRALAGEREGVIPHVGALNHGFFFFSFFVYLCMGAVL
ncbi:NAD(P)-binding protein [Camillea tinctor]|nr:NAD(P)-binding protein [Camillea tinctor]